MHDTDRQRRWILTSLILLLRCRRFSDENPRRINRQTSVGIIHRVAPTTASAHVKSYNGVSRWKIFTVSNHLPGAEGIVCSVPFENDQVDVGRSAARTTMNMHLYFSSVSVVPTRPDTLLPVELKYLSLDSLAAFPSPLPFDSFHACWPLRFHFVTVSFAAYATSYSTLFPQPRLFYRLYLALPASLLLVVGLSLLLHL